MTTVVLVIVSLALIAMSVTFAVTAHALFMERRKNFELSKELELRRPPRVEARKLAEPSPGYIAEYDIIVDGNVTSTIRIPENWLEHDRISL